MESLCGFAHVGPQSIESALGTCSLDLRPVISRSAQSLTDPCHTLSHLAGKSAAIQTLQSTYRSSLSQATGTQHGTNACHTLRTLFQLQLQSQGGKHRPCEEQIVTRMV